MDLALPRERSAGMIAVQGSQASAVLRHLQLPLTRTGDRVLSQVRAVSAGALSVQGWDNSSRYFGQEQRRWDVMQDQMIGVESLAAFATCLDGELTQWHRSKERVALLVAEVGLPAGDNGPPGRDVVEHVRIALAQRLRLAVGAGDTVMRIGADSFAIICRGTRGWPALSLVLERLHAVDREPVDLSGDDLPGNDVWGTVSVAAIFADEVGHAQASGRELLHQVLTGMAGQDFERPSPQELSTRAPIKGTAR
jgi:GGDEF domain-containing protein